MGNRAVIRVEGSQLGVYLHWNGGEDSVYAFLKAAKDLGIRTPESGPSYFYARFVQMIGNFFGGTTSVGIDVLDHLDTDNGDNGVYVIDGNLNIIKREHGQEQLVNAVRSNDIYEHVMLRNREVFKS